MTTDNNVNATPPTTEKPAEETVSPEVASHLRTIIARQQQRPRFATAELEKRFQQQREEHSQQM